VPRVALLALAVGLVLADSSVVTLGLPDVLAEFDASPPSVAWVLTGYNLVLALVSLPAAAFVLRRGDPAVAARAGLLVFALASLVCALAPSLGVLVFARCVQGVGGAVIAVSALALLSVEAGGRVRGAAIWGAAGTLGAAVGPALGGALTQALSWEAIFFVQVPVALVCLTAVRSVAVPVSDERTRPDVRHLIALGFTGAGLTAALFLLVLLLMAGWRLSPIAAALTVSVMPVAALLGGRLPGGDTRSRAGAGAVLLGGGLAALGLLPEAGVAWTVAPQVLVGLGLGLSLGALTEAALQRRSPLVWHGAWTLTARHVGVVAALALLTPMFNADLEKQEDHAIETVMARLLDSDVSATTKFRVGVELGGELNGPTNEVPDVGPVFDAVDADGEERARLDALQADVEDQLDRAATTAFERSFIVAAVLSLFALIPLLWPRGSAPPPPAPTAELPRRVFT
jgi:MFS family permease